MQKRDILFDRLKAFALDIVELTRALPKNEENKIFIRQVIRSASSIGANYAESKYAQSNQEFIHCLKIARKEANETLYWLDLISESNLIKNSSFAKTVDENEQILKILISPIKTLIAKNNT